MSLSRIMKLLSKQELKKAEEALRQYFPQSQQAYGHVFLLNRVDIKPTDVLVDRWPDFRVLLVKSGQQQALHKMTLKPDLSNRMCIFAKDKSCLFNIITRMDVLDWKQKIILSVDLQHEELLKAVAEKKGVPMTKSSVSHLMEFKDPSKLTSERLSFQVSSVKESHVALINSTWKFGMGELTEPLLRSMIRKLPSYCVLDKEGCPVSWVLTYDSGAMGVMYTLPEHRRKGYAKALTATLVKKLLSEGYPVYCFVEEDNLLSYRLLTSSGFTKALSYRKALFNFNCL